ncbi:hypothetical protein NDU88_007084 [Pleurodeles waltl]|uniref:Uncharacterized protein n=1 Tax=Pleurodeles waltl TaxID=8319 RepID=A0AAV7QJR3_PLEWA|nr:hypothetical protein NDU88_007084 [Pleurodeles waltl]
MKLPGAAIGEETRERRNFHSRQNKLHTADMGAFRGVRDIIFHAEPSNTTVPAKGDALVHQMTPDRRTQFTP